MFWQDFGRPEEVRRYAAFLDRLADLVLGKYRGSLKAEHGTGRNMAPFVEREWGARAYAMMREIKALFDPLGILNPDVLLSGDPGIHVKNLKPLPLADPLVDKCIECGFCESVRPSRNVTLTPRQRIATYREIVRLRGGNKREGSRGFPGPRLRALERGYAYQGEQTCATDGLCAVNCPVGIDTGALIKSLRTASRSSWQNRLADGLAGHSGFLRRHQLDGVFKLNLECNHATLAGHSFHHEVELASREGMLGSVDANSGDTLLGWDTDQFPMDPREAAMTMRVLLNQGGIGSGGFNFDAKLRRESTDPEDLFIAHIGGMDTLARGLLMAARMQEDGVLDGWIRERYQSWDSDLGAGIEAGKANFRELENRVLETAEPSAVSGKQERYESLLNTYL